MASAGEIRSGPPGVRLTYVARPCPLCGSTDDTSVLAPSTVDESALDQFAFASRKLPELMHHRLVECPDCAVVYASPMPDAASLAEAYEDAAFASGLEAQYASRTYAELVRPLLADLPRLRALDVGTGDGVFLERLLELGVEDVQGVEPSAAPIAAAAPHVRNRIVHDVFRPEQLTPGSFSLITCFQTIEHLPDPLAFCREAAALLAEVGSLVLVGHDRRSLVNQALRRHSPIFDIEHVQLFCPLSARCLLERAGLAGIRVRAIPTAIRSATGRGSRRSRGLRSGASSARSTACAWVGRRSRCRSATWSSSANAEPEQLLRPSAPRRPT